MRENDRGIFNHKKTDSLKFLLKIKLIMNSLGFNQLFMLKFKSLWSPNPFSFSKKY